MEKMIITETIEKIYYYHEDTAAESQLDFYVVARGTAFIY
jgi:hypothetical protein